MIYIVSPGGTREKGGMGRIVDNFTTDLRENRPDVRFTIVDTYGPGKFHKMPFYFAAAMARLGAAFLTGRTKLVHVHMADYGSVLRKGSIIALASLFRVPVVLHLHGGRITDQVREAGPWMHRAIRHIVGLSSEIVVLGDFWRRFITEDLGVQGPRITVLPNAVPGPREVPQRPTGRTVRLLFLGRLIQLKGIHVLLEALAREECRSRPWEMVIAGDGDLDSYRAQAEALGLARRVRFTGWLDQDGCRAQLGDADVLVQPSLYEGLPMAVLEAMAHGLAIVATPVGSVTDAIQDECTGLLVPPGDAQGLANALVRILDDAALRQRLGEGARARFLASYDIAAYRERIIDIYRRNARGWAPDQSVLAAGAGENAS